MTTKLSNETALVADYLTVPEVCTRLRLGRTAVYALMERGEVSFAKFGKSRRIEAKSLAEYIRRATIPARAG